MEKKWVYTGKRWIYDIGEIAVIVLQFVAVFSLLCMICAVTPELPAGETVGQWMWFGKGVWISAGCVIASCWYSISRKIPGRRFCASSISRSLWHGASCCWEALRRCGACGSYTVSRFPGIRCMPLRVLSLTPAHTEDIWRWRCLSACIVTYTHPSVKRSISSGKRG